MRGEELVSYMPALLLCLLIAIHMSSWPPQLESILQLPVLAWLSVVIVTVASARGLRLMGASPESIWVLGKISLACMLSLTVLWAVAGFLLDLNPVQFYSYLGMMVAGCVLMLFWPHKPERPQREETLPPSPVGPSQLGKVQRKLLDYVKSHQGRVERKKVLVDLGITDDLFVAAVRGLERQGKIRLKEGEL